MNRIVALSATATVFFGAAALIAGPSQTFAQGKVSLQDFHFAVPAAPAPSMRLYTSVQYPYALRTAGGVRVAVGDVTGDGTADVIAAAGAGAAGHVKVFDGRTGGELSALNPALLGAAAGDVNGDGRADIIINTGAATGGHVRVFDGATGAELRLPAQTAANTYTGATTVNGGVLQAQGAPAPYSHTTGGGNIAAPGAQPAGLLLPAIQKVREAAAR